MQTTAYNTNEKVKIVNHAIINNSEMNRLVCDLAGEVVDGKRDSLPTAFADLFSLEIVTRPSGSRYGVLDFS